MRLETKYSYLDKTRKFFIKEKFISNEGIKILEKYEGNVRIKDLNA